MKTFNNEQIIDTVNEFITENPEFDTFYNDNVGFQQWKRTAEDMLGFTTTKRTAYNKLNKFMNQAIGGQWAPQR